VKLVLAAPDSFLSAACVSQTAAASDSHSFIEAGECGAGKLLLGGSIVASRIGDGSADREARKQERKSKAFHGFLPKMVVG
jgi:hypothetical protein